MKIFQLCGEQDFDVRPNASLHFLSVCSYVSLFILILLIWILALDPLVSLLGFYLSC